MKRLSSNHIKQKMKLASSFSKIVEEIENTKSEQRGGTNLGEGQPERLIAEVIELVQAVNSFMSEIHEAQEEYMGDRSERWHESAAGEAYQEWAEASSQEFDELDEGATLAEIQDYCQNIVDALMELPDRP